MGKVPAVLFYIGDWMKDPNLSMCSPATRGIWMDLLCAMHERDRSGQITGTPDQLARLCRCTAPDVIAALADLQSTQTADVTFRKANVTVINRRMEREHKERLSGRERVHRHREKRRCNAPSSSSVTSSISSSEENKEMSGAGSTVLDEVFEFWKSTLNHLGAKLTSERKRVVEARIKEGYSLNDIKTAIIGCRDSAFHQGQNDRGTVFDDLTLICRSGSKLEQFIALGKEHENGRPARRHRESEESRRLRESVELLESGRTGQADRLLGDGITEGKGSSNV